MVDMVNKPRVSRFIAGTYAAFAVFIATLIAFFAYASFSTLMGIVVLTSIAAVLVFVETIMLLILASIYRTRYVLTNEELIIKTTRLIGGNKRINLRDVANVERTFIPFGVRLFGASFHGGYYYIPRLGKTFLAITNFNDGILVRTKHGNYIITPEKPNDFVKTIQTHAGSS